jgi:hypothetical protein
MQSIRILAGAVALCLTHACAPATQCVQPDDTIVSPRFGAIPATAFLVDGDSNADVTSDAVSDAGFKLVCFEIVMTNGSTPVGVYEFEGSIDGTNYFDLYLDEHRVYGANFASFTGGTQVSVSSPAGTVIIGACIENPPPNVRVFYDRTSGGAADTIDIYSFVRRN